MINVNQRPFGLSRVTRHTSTVFTDFTGLYFVPTTNIKLYIKTKAEAVTLHIVTEILWTRNHVQSKQMLLSLFKESDPCVTRVASDDRLHLRYEQ